jgi:N-acetylglutamate synthase-like GNAT family acetyltransferase
LIRIRRITPADPLYPQERTLREEVLLRPIGFDMARFEAEFAGLEERFEHFVAVFDHPSGPRVVGCAALLVDDDQPGVGRLTQMAVDPQRQGEGIGRRLVVSVESRAFGELGLTSLYCHAQVPVAGFFRSLGWLEDAQVFTEAGVPHKRMVMRSGAD